MNRSDVVTALMVAENLSRACAEQVVDVLLGSMARALVDNDRIEIRNFGRFITKFYPARRGRNPRTGAKVQIAPKRLTHFKPGKELKEQLEGV